MGDRGRIATGLVLVDHFHARRARQQLARRVRGDLVAGLDGDRFGVTIEHRHAHGGRVHQDAVITKDLAGFPDQLHFFLGEAVILEVIDVRNQVEGNLHREALRVDVLEAEQLAGLLAKLFQCRTATAGNGLVGRHVDALDAVLAVQRGECDQHLHGRAVRVGDDAARAVLQRLRVHFRDDQRDVIVVTEGRGVVDHHGTGGRELGTELLGDAATGGKQRDIHTVRIEGAQVLDLDLLALELDLATGRTRGREQAQRGDREVALGQDGQHGFADSTGGTDDGDVETTICIAHGGTSCWVYRPVADT